MNGSIMLELRFWNGLPKVYGVDLYRVLSRGRWETPDQTIQMSLAAIQAMQHFLNSRMEKKEHFYYIKNKIRSPTLFLCWSRSFRYENVYKCFLKFTFRLLLFKWIIDDLPFDFISVVAAVIVDGGEWFLVPVGHVHFPWAIVFFPTETHFENATLCVPSSLS